MDLYIQASTDWSTDDLNLDHYLNDEVLTWTAEELAGVDPSFFLNAETELAASSVAEDLDILHQDLLINALQVDNFELNAKTSMEPVVTTVHLSTSNSKNPSKHNCNY